MRFILSFTCVVALSGCAFSSVNRPDPATSNAVTHMDLKAPEAVVVKAAESALTSMGYEIEGGSADTGIVRTKVKTVATPEACDCGTWNAGTISGTAESVFVAKIDAAQSGSAVSIEHTCRTNFTGRNLFYMPTRRESYSCVSKGSIEREFWDATQRAVIRATPVKAN